MIRGVTEFLAVRREGVVVLPAERERRRVVVARGKVKITIVDAMVVVRIGGIVSTVGSDFAVHPRHKDVSPAAFLEGIPVTKKQTGENQCLDLGFLLSLKRGGIAAGLLARGIAALGINIRREQDIFPVGRPELAAGFGRDGSELVGAGHGS